MTQNQGVDKLPQTQQGSSSCFEGLQLLLRDAHTILETNCKWKFLCSSSG